MQLVDNPDKSHFGGVGVFCERRVRLDYADPDNMHARSGALCTMAEALGSKYELGISESGRGVIAHLESIHQSKKWPAWIRQIATRTAARLARQLKLPHNIPAKFGGSGLVRGKLSQQSRVQLLNTMKRDFRPFSITTQPRLKWNEKDVVLSTDGGGALLASELTTQIRIAEDRRVLFQGGKVQKAKVDRHGHRRAVPTDWMRRNKILLSSGTDNVLPLLRARKGTPEAKDWSVGIRHQWDKMKLRSMSSRTKYFLRSRLSSLRGRDVYRALTCISKWVPQPRVTHAYARELLTELSVPSTTQLDGTTRGSSRIYGKPTRM